MFGFNTCSGSFVTYFKRVQFKTLCILASVWSTETTEATTLLIPPLELMATNISSGVIISCPSPETYNRQEKICIHGFLIT
jgi:hypothetical protein